MEFFIGKATGICSAAAAIKFSFRFFAPVTVYSRVVRRGIFSLTLWACRVRNLSFKRAARISNLNDYTENSFQPATRYF